MGSTGRTPNVYGIPATLNWCVEAIAQLKGQVFGIIQNGTGGGGTQDLASVLLEGNYANNSINLTDGGARLAAYSPDGLSVVYGDIDGTSTVRYLSNSIIALTNEDTRQTILEFIQDTPGGVNTISFPDATGTIALDGNYLRLDGTTSMTADLDNGGNKIVNVTTPTADTDGVNKAYVDTFVTGLSPKTAVRVATTDTLIGLYDNDLGTFTMTATGILAVDGVNLVQGNRVLIKNQVSKIENGIYDVTTEGILGVATIFTRSSDANTGAELVSAYTYTGTEGLTQASKGYVQKTAAPITLGLSDIDWALFNSNAYGEGTGIRIGSSNLIYSTLAEGLTGGQDAIGGTAANDTFTLKGSSSAGNRTTTDPAFIVKTMGPLTGTVAQVFNKHEVTVNQSSVGAGGYTALKVAVTETSVGTGTKNFLEFLGGSGGSTSRFAVANTGTITVAAGANRFANDVPATSSDAAFTLSLIQNETWIRTGFTVPRVITVPLDATVAFPIGAQINIAQWGAGTVTFAPFNTTVTIRSKGSLKTINGRWVWVTLKKVDINEWALIGDLTT